MTGYKYGAGVEWGDRIGSWWNARILDAKNEKYSLQVKREGKEAADHNSDSTKEKIKAFSSE